MYFLISFLFAKVGEVLDYFTLLSGGKGRLFVGGVCLIDLHESSIDLNHGICSGHRDMGSTIMEGVFGFRH